MKDENEKEQALMRDDKAQSEKEGDDPSPK